MSSSDSGTMGLRNFGPPAGMVGFASMTLPHPHHQHQQQQQSAESVTLVHPDRLGSCGTVISAPGSGPLNTVIHHPGPPTPRAGGGGQLPHLARSTPKAGAHSITAAGSSHKQHHHQQRHPPNAATMAAGLAPASSASSSSAAMSPTSPIAAHCDRSFTAGTS